LGFVGCVFAGCGDYCEYDETKCDGDRILRCVESDGFGDHTFTLDDECATGERCVDVVEPRTGDGSDGEGEGSDGGDGANGEGIRHAVCSLTGETDPRCPDIRTTRICIDATTQLTCWFGYGSNLHACDVACIEPGAFCAIETEPSPACDAIEGDGSGYGCEARPGADAVLVCRDGYATDRIACADEQQCIELGTPYHRPYCVSEEPCAGSDTFCTGNRIEGCIRGRTVSMTCSDGMQCEEFGVLGPDNRPTGATEAQCLRR
jgi:hypothetical protein